MTILIAPDSFKGNMSAPQVCDAIEEGIKRADGKAKIFKIPLADGGEGTARAVTQAAGGRFVKVPVRDPLGRKIEAAFGLIDDGKTAVLDMASASGLELLRPEELNPLKTSSRGTGELIKAALDSGAEKIILGIGGSATNDGGIGMLSALGFIFMDEKGNPTGEGGEALLKIAAFDASNADSRLKNVQITAACDVTNPLTGTNGASAVFGPQKGAGAEMVKILDAGLSRLARVLIKAGLTEDTDHSGDGAAGGLGAALRIFLNAKMESGALLVMRASGFFERLKEADLVITGEGRTDSQTAGGKLCSAAARESRKAGVPIALLSGALNLAEAKPVDSIDSSTDSARNPRDPNGTLLSIFDYAVSISCGQTGLEEMIRDSRRDLSLAAENLVRAILIGSRLKT